MTTLYPHSPGDIALAPTLIHLERNLQELRDSDDVPYVLALELDDAEAWYHSPLERAERVRRAVTRNVDLHGLQVLPSEDLHGLAVIHGEYRVTLMLGRGLVDYVLGVT